jgi:hypothetical protein
MVDPDDDFLVPAILGAIATRAAIKKPAASGFFSLLKR